MSAEFRHCGDTYHDNQSVYTSRIRYSTPAKRGTSFALKGSGLLVRPGSAPNTEPGAGNCSALQEFIGERARRLEDVAVRVPRLFNDERSEDVGSREKH